MVFRRKGIRYMLLMLPKDGTAADQVVGKVTAYQAYNRYGP
jgi:hypothetical protein